MTGTVKDDIDGAAIPTLRVTVGEHELVKVDIGLNYAIPSNYDQLNLWVYGDSRMTGAVVSVSPP